MAGMEAQGAFVRKGWIVLALCAGFASVAMAGEVSGFFDEALMFNPRNGGEILLLSTVGTEYSTGEWSLGAKALWTNFGGLADILLVSAANVGAFEGFLTADFIQIGSSGLTLSNQHVEGGVRWTLAGVDLWSLASLEVDAWNHAIESKGIGFSLGAHGIAGAVELWIDAEFGLSSTLDSIYWVGLDTYWDRLLFCDRLGVQDEGCSVGWTQSNMIVEFPVGCLSAIFRTSVDCDGFQFADVWVEQIEIFEDWLTIEEAGVIFTMEEKWAHLSFVPGFADDACITPYFALDTSGDQWIQNAVDGIRLVGLQLECTLDDVTFIVAERFGDIGWIGSDGRLHGMPRSWRDEISELPTCESLTIFDLEVDESIGLEFGGDGCCGVDSLVGGVYTFFDADLTGVSLFDVDSIFGRVQYAATPGLAFSFYTYVGHEGVRFLAFGVRIEWGVPALFTDEAMCCRSGPT
jgi:hypothetical protein